MATLIGTLVFGAVLAIIASLIQKGSSGTATLTLLRKDGYASPITLSASGMPTGVTVTFAPQSVDQTQSSSTAVVTVAATASSGNPILTFKATGTGVSEKTVVYSLVIP